MPPAQHNIALSSAALRVHAPADLHTELRSKLGLDPTLAARAGEKVLDPAAPPGETFPEDIWVAIAPVDPFRPLDEHLTWIADKARPGMAYIRELIERAIDIDVWCTCTTDGSSAIVSIAPHLLESLALLGVKVSVRFAAVPELKGVAR